MKFEDCVIGLEIIDLETNCHGTIINIDINRLGNNTIQIDSEENSQRCNHYGEKCPRTYWCRHNEVEPLKNNNK